jgi:hypothetical protein
MLLLSPAMVAANPQQVKNPDKVVCQLVTDSGSRIPLRVCRTAAQWAEIEAANQQAVKDVTDKNFGPGLASQMPH